MGNSKRVTNFHKSIPKPTCWCCW